VLFTFLAESVGFVWKHRFKVRLIAM